LYFKLAAGGNAENIENNKLVAQHLGAVAGMQGFAAMN